MLYLLFLTSRAKSAQGTGLNRGKNVCFCNLKSKIKESSSFYIFVFVEQFIFFFEKKLGGKKLAVFV